MKYTISPGSRAGFTLLEVLVTLVLTSVTLSLAAVALRTFGSYYERGSQSFDAEVAEVLSLDRLADIIESASDYYVRDSNQAPVLFFRGDATQMEFISQVDWLEDKYSSYNMLRVEDVKRAMGDQQNLVLYYRPLNQRPLLEMPGKGHVADMSRVIILRDIGGIRFRYLGSSSAKQTPRALLNENLLSDLVWSDEYDATDMTYLPNKISIDIETDDAGSSSHIIPIKVNNPLKRAFFL